MAGWSSSSSTLSDAVEQESRDARSSYVRQRFVTRLRCHRPLSPTATVGPAFLQVIRHIMSESSDRVVNESVHSSILEEILQDWDRICSNGTNATQARVVPRSSVRGAQSLQLQQVFVFHALFSTQFSSSRRTLSEGSNFIILRGVPKTNTSK